MAFYIGDIEKQTTTNTYYRRTLYTDKNVQLVLMSLKPRQEIGGEKHRSTTQFFRVERGVGAVIIGTKVLRIRDGVAFIVPPNTYHNVVNLSNHDSLKLYTIYSPPEHPPNTVQKNKPRNS